MSFLTFSFRFSLSNVQYTIRHLPQFTFCIPILYSPIILSLSILLSLTEFLYLSIVNNLQCAIFRSIFIFRWQFTEYYFSANFSLYSTVCIVLLLFHCLSVSLFNSSSFLYLYIIVLTNKLSISNNKLI